MDKKLSNHDLLLQDGLVEYNDPVDGLKKQVTIEAAKRIAVGNLVMRKHVIELGISTEEDFAEKTEEVVVPTPQEEVTA